MKNLAIVAGSLLLVGILGGCAEGSEEPVSSTVLLDKAYTTVLGQDFSYPVDSPEISSSIVVLQPGASTGWHFHEAPMYAYVLEGTLEVTYDDGAGEKTNTYKAGEAIMEGLDVAHNGVNATSSSVSILVVNMGSKNLDNTVLLDR